MDFPCRIRKQYSNILLSATMMFEAILTLILAVSNFEVAKIPVGDEFCKAYFYVFYFACHLTTFCSYFGLWFRIYAAFYRNSIFLTIYEQVLLLCLNFALSFFLFRNLY